jgi:hypothetical protein
MHLKIMYFLLASTSLSLSPILLLPTSLLPTSLPLYVIQLKRDCEEKDTNAGGGRRAEAGGLRQEIK